METSLLCKICRSCPITSLLDVVHHNRFSFETGHKATRLYLQQGGFILDSGRRQITRSAKRHRSGLSRLGDGRLIPARSGCRQGAAASGSFLRVRVQGGRSNISLVGQSPLLPCIHVHHRSVIGSEHPYRGDVDKVFFNCFCTSSTWQDATLDHTIQRCGWLIRRTKRG
jgi:hypothetical protein